MTMPPLPPPDLEEHETELWGQNVCDDYWRLAKVKAYGAACAAQERARVLAWVDYALSDHKVCWPGEIDIMREQIVSGRARGEA